MIDAQCSGAFPCPRCKQWPIIRTVRHGPCTVSASGPVQPATAKGATVSVSPACTILFNERWSVGPGGVCGA